MNTSLERSGLPAQPKVGRTTELSRTGRRAGATLLLLLSFAILLSVFGGIRLGSITMSAFGSALMAAAFAIGSLRERTSLPPLVALVVACPFAVLAVMAGASVGRPITIGGAQQAVVWAGSSLAIVYAYNLGASAGAHSLSTRLTRAMEITSAILVMVTAIDAFLMPTVGVSPRIAALGALVPLCWFTATWVGLRSRGGLFAVGLTTFIVLTLSRTAMATALVVLLLGRPNARRLVSVRTVARSALLIVAAAVLVTRWKPLHNRFFSGDVSLNVGGVGINGMGRVRIWQDLWTNAWIEPLTGHGLGSARLRLEGLAVGTDQPHQDFLRLFYEGGILSVSIFAVGIVAAFIALRRLGRARSMEDHGFVRAAQLMLFVVLTTALTDNSLVYPFMMFPYGLMVGLGLRAERVQLQLLRS